MTFETATGMLRHQQNIPRHKSWGSLENQKDISEPDDDDMSHVMADISQVTKQEDEKSPGSKNTGRKNPYKTAIHFRRAVINTTYLKHEPFMQFTYLWLSLEKYSVNKVVKDLCWAELSLSPVLPKVKSLML